MLLEECYFGPAAGDCCLAMRCRKASDSATIKSSVHVPLQSSKEVNGQ